MNTKCPACKGKKDRGAEMCLSCRKSKWQEDAHNKPISAFFNTGNARVKYAQIRKWSRLVMKRAGKLECCEKCDFDLVVEVNHKKPLSTFPPETLLKVVNSLKNLEALCPNHHAEAERA